MKNTTDCKTSTFGNQSESFKLMISRDTYLIYLLFFYFLCLKSFVAFLQVYVATFNISFNFAINIFNANLKFVFAKELNIDLHAELQNFNFSSIYWNKIDRNPQTDRNVLNLYLFIFW